MARRFEGVGSVRVRPTRLIGHTGAGILLIGLCLLLTMGITPAAGVSETRPD